MFDSEKFAAWVASQNAAKTYDPKGGRAFAPEPLTGEDLAAVVAIAPEDKWSDTLRRIVKLGGNRLNDIDKEVETLLASEAGALLKASAGTIAGTIADTQIDTPRPDGATDEGFRVAIRQAAVKKLKAWADEHAAARAIIADCLTKLRGAAPHAGFSEADLAAFRDALGVMSALGVVPQKAAA